MRFLLEYVLPFAGVGTLVILGFLFKQRFFNEWFDDWVGRHIWDRARREQRGFEVKQTTGETPVLRERDNDHG